MEFSADIKFSSKPMENKEVTITYSGYLFKNNSSSLTIVYGFGNNWMYTKEQKMEKTENGFVANVKMLNFSEFNFCFKNENNFWDNNYNSNFVTPISKFRVDDESFVLNENTIEEIITNLVEYDVSQVKAPVAENTSFEVYFEQNENIDISDTVVSVTPEESLNENLNKAFSKVYEGTEEVNKIVEEQEDNSESQIFDINEFSELFEDFEEDESFFDNFYKVSGGSTNVENIITNSSDNTVDDVVSDIIDNLYEGSKNSEHTQDIKPAYILKADKSNEETALVVSPRALGKFYSFKKRMKLAVYKFFYSIPKLLNGSYSEENNN